MQPQSKISGMKLRCKDDMEGLQYLVTDEETPRSKRTLDNPLLRIRNACSGHLSTYRMILVLALILSTMALILSIVSFVRLHQIQNNQTPHFGTSAAVDDADALASAADKVIPSRSPSSLQRLLKNFKMMNDSLSIMKHQENERSHEMTENIIYYVRNETADIRNKLEELEELTTSNQNNALHFNASIPILKERQARQNETIQQRLAEMEDFSRNTMIEIQHLRQQVNLLNNTTTNKREKITHHVSRNALTLRNMTKLWNETQRSLLEIQDRLSSLAADRVYKYDDINVKFIRVSDKLEHLNHTSQKLLDQFASANKQLQSTESVIEQFKSHSNQTAESLEVEIRSARTAAASQLAKTTNTLKSTIRTLQDLQRKSTAHFASLTRQDARIDSCEIKSNELSRLMVETNKALQGKVDVGWIEAPNGFSYHITQKPFTSWGSARDYCDNLNATLAYRGPRQSNMKNFFFRNLLEPSGYDGAWIGLSDSINEGTWKWLDGSPLTYSNWADGQPNNLPSRRNSHIRGQDCVEMNKSEGKWNDLWCEGLDVANNRNAALCERVA